MTWETVLPNEPPREVLPPREDFCTTAERMTQEEAEASIERWGDEVVAAWLDRRHAHFEWLLEEPWIHLSVTVEGRSITYGECLVTRARDGFLAIVSGKRYRTQSLKWILEVLQHALARRDVPGFVVTPPHPVDFVDAETLDRWYDGAKKWHGLAPEDLVRRYVGIAERMVDAMVDGTGARHNDGYQMIEAASEGIWAFAECVASTSREAPRIVLLSSRRFRIGGRSWLLREAVRVVLEDRGIAYREVRPTCSGPAMSGHLRAAWDALRPRLFDGATT